MMKIIDGVEIEMTPQEIAAWKAEQAIYKLSKNLELSDDELLQQAMLEDFIERAAKNSTTPKAVKEAALRRKAKKND